MEIARDVQLADHAYYRIGGPARHFAEPRNVDDLRSIADFISREKPRVFILGAGSNTLFDDRGFAGLVIHAAKLNDSLLRVDARAIEAGCSVPNIRLLRLCMRDGLRGLEFLAGVPGSVGGAVYMNAGTSRGETRDRLLSVTAFDLSAKKEVLYAGGQLRFEYRSQLFLKETEIILSARFQADPADPRAVQEDIKDLLEKRKKSQPIDKPSCGSVFKNPGPALQAWKLISDCGLRGRQIGAAQISDMHANFIVNLGGAKAADVLALIALAKETVKSKFGIELEEEVRIVPYE